MSQQIRDQLQATLGSAYTLERELGGGGMSRVFVAEETALHRKVVVKLLSPELAQGISVERFEREIQTAAALQQANIVPVLASGSSNGLPYYTMPFVEGESLRHRLGRGPLAITEVIGVLRDVAKALAYAHQRGVVHRDIKPDNVLLSGGTAVVTDFGIAKAISASRTESSGATLTQIGTSIGTPAYMAPEQAAGDPGVDHRADIYSLGAMAYELLAGQVVFANRTPQRMLAAHMGEPPTPVANLRPDTPAPLADLVMQCLAKEADARPQHAADIARLLDTITSGSGMQTMPHVLLGGAGMFRKALAIYAGAFVVVAVVAKAAIVGIGLPDWVFPGSLIVMALGLPVVLWTGYVQRVARRAMTATPTFTPGGTPSMVQGTIATMALRAAPRVSWYRTARGGMYAFGTFIVVIAAFMVMRAFGIGPAGSLIGKGAFGENETIVVADFASPKDDQGLGATAAEALRTDLAQSKNLRVLTKASVAEVLRLMKQPTDVAVKFDLARQVATREGAKAVLDGEISQLGDTYVISARLVGALDGAELATFRETAKGQDQLVEALGSLSRDVRSKVGESLRNVHESSPLERVTTASLPALRKYVEGVQVISATGDNAKGRALLLEAVQLDSTFAMAWRRIAASYSGSFSQQGPAMDAIEHAFRFRDHLSEDERLLTESYYYSNGPQPDIDRSIAAYEQLIERDSLNRSALNNVAILYIGRRDFARGEDRLRRAVRVPDPFGGSFETLIGLQLFLGKAAAAETTQALFQKTLPTHGAVDVTAGQIANALDRPAAAESLFKVVATRSGVGAESRSEAAGYLAGLELTRGHVRDERRWAAAAIPDSSQVPASALALLRLTASLDSAWTQVAILGDVPAAKAMAQRALARYPIDKLSPRDRPWNIVLGVAALMRDVPMAQAAYAGAVRDLVPASPRRGLGAVARGWLALAEGKGAEAAAQFGEANTKGDFDPLDYGPARAIGFDMAGQPDSAIAEYEKFAATHDPFFITRPTFIATTHRRLGELYEARGNIPKAAEHYRAFVDAWKDADPELQPQVKAVRDKLAKLGSVEGRKP
ncbi:MAG TPA: protein kinase [Gemmatimonadaceae bacterium]|nr:protein kinase [Gemmatimonadaceae bacterium]